MSSDALFEHFLDDAAIFPPGNLALDAALAAHHRHRAGVHRSLVGPLVVGGAALPGLSGLTADLPPSTVDLAVTTPLADAATAVGAVQRNAALRLVGLEIALPVDLPADDVLPALREVAAATPEVTMWLEIPRDGRRSAIIEALAGTPYLAKFRTGGVQATLYPDEQELADALVQVARTGLPFKATAGLHHALRNTDPDTGFEQHGFLNVLVATEIALRGRSGDDVAAALAERDAEHVVGRARELDPQVRTVFRSVGTCSIADPINELVELNMLDPTMKEDLP